MSTGSSSLPTRIFLVLMLGAVIGLGLLASTRGRKTPTPDVFMETPTTLAAAFEQSERTGKPVFVLATADWCPPCQALKRGPLVDERVTDILAGQTIPYYLDVDAKPQEAVELQVEGIPAMFVVADGSVVARTVGGMSTEALLQWLDSI